MLWRPILFFAFTGILFNPHTLQSVANATSESGKAPLPKKAISCHLISEDSKSNFLNESNYVSIDVTNCHDIFETTIWSPIYDGIERNTVATDKQAIYRYLSLPVLRSEEYGSSHFELRGIYPNCRFFSYQIYNEESHEISDLVVDYEINPSPGSVQPFRDGIPFPEDDNCLNYTLPIIDAPEIERDSTSVLYGGYIGDDTYDENILVGRVYLPTDQVLRADSIPVPRIYYTYNPDEVDDYPSIPTSYDSICEMIRDRDQVTYFQRTIDQLQLLEDSADSVAPLMFENASNSFPLYYPGKDIKWFIATTFLASAKMAFPVIPDRLVSDDVCYNMATVYFAAWLNPDRSAKKLAVVRIKVPSSPDTLRGEYIKPGLHQTRYWSICSHQSLNAVYTYTCGLDHHLALDPDSDQHITIVFSHEDDRPEGLCDVNTGDSPQINCNFNWMPYPSSIPLIYFRHLIPDEIIWPEAPFFCIADSDEPGPCNPEELFDHMGDYYPQAKYCSKREFEENRCGLHH